MAEIIIMPKLGFNMSVGKLLQWYKKEGDPVKKGEPLFSIETDKTSIDIEANHDGVFLKKFIEEGDSVEVTLPIAIIGDANENIDDLISKVNKELNREGAAEAPKAEEAAPVQQQAAAAASQAARPTGMVKITPRARRVAIENGLDPKTLAIVGTGYQGGISEKDVLDYLTSNKVRISPVAKKIAEDQGISLDGITGTGSMGKIMKQDLTSGAAAPAAAAIQSDAQFSPDGKEIAEIIPYSGVRKIIGERLSQSKFTAPHLYFTQKVNLEKLLNLRKQINEAQDKKTSVTDYIVRASVIALQKYPDMNASLADEKIIKYKTINLGIAVAAPTGLIVPVVKDAEKKTLLDISKDSGVLFEKAREGKLTPDEYSGGTFTVSNLGMFGIENFTAIINPPESGILSVSATKDEPFVETDESGNKTIAIKPMMNMTLTVDHRIIDGLLAAQVVTEIKRLLENPIELLI